MDNLFKSLFKSPLNKIFSVISRSKGGHPFPQFQNLPPYYPLGGTGNVYETKIVRKRQIVDPNLPLFDRCGPLKWSDWRMLRDVRRRHLFARYRPTHQILYTIRKSKLLPNIIRETAHEDSLKLPRHSTIQFLNNRCIISSRSRGNVKRYKISRHFFRQLADYNQLYGVAKACWG